MKFNDTQQEIYETSLNFVTGNLDVLLGKSYGEKTSVNALFFLLNIALAYDEASTVQIAEMFYPEEKYAKVRAFFIKINQIVNKNDLEHSFIKNIKDERFFTSTNIEEYQKELVNHFTTSFREALTQWSQNKLSQGIFVKEDMLHLYAQYSGLLNSSESEQLKFG